MKKTWIYISVGIALLVIGWLVFSWWKNKAQGNEGADDEATTGTIDKLPARGVFSCKRNLATANAQTVLQYGDCGAPVKQLQQFINTLLPAASKISVDGKFGTNTESALLKATGNIRIAYSDFNPVTTY